jgi:hypothetical protein
MFTPALDLNGPIIDSAAVASLRARLDLARAEVEAVMDTVARAAVAYRVAMGIAGRFPGLAEFDRPCEQFLADAGVVALGDVFEALADVMAVGR